MTPKQLKLENMSVQIWSHIKQHSKERIGEHDVIVAYKTTKNFQNCLHNGEKTQ